MRTSLGAIAIAAAAVAGAAGCKDKPKHQPTAPAAGSGSAAAAPAGSGAGSAEGAPQGNVLDLPKASGSPPKRTSKPLLKADLDQLATLDVAGWNKIVRYSNDNDLEVRYKTKERPILAVTINAGKCFDCVPLELPRWQARTDALKVLLADELRDRKDTVFEVGEAKLAGAPLIYTYQLGFYFGTNDSDEQVGAYSNAYALYHNDGINQIRVVAQYMDDPVATRAELVDLAPREDLAKIALAFLDAYTQRW